MSVARHRSKLDKTNRQAAAPDGEPTPTDGKGCMTSKTPNELLPTTAIVSRRSLVGGLSVGIAGSIVARPAGAETLADVPPRGPGADLGAHSERSQYVKLNRIPEAGPGMRPVDSDNAINSKTPLGKLVGSITPTDLHYERSHSGVPDIDPAQHRLLIHGMVQKPLVLTVDDLKAMPSISRIVFIECTGNGWEKLEEGRSEPDRAEHTRPGQHQRMDRRSTEIPDRADCKGQGIELDARGRRRRRRR